MRIHQALAGLALATCAALAAAGEWTDLVAVPAIELTTERFKRIDLDIDQVRGRWVRISADVGDARVRSVFTVQAFSGTDLRIEERLVFTPPSRCTPVLGTARCSAAVQIPAAARRAIATIYYERLPATVTDIRVEVARRQLAEPAGSRARLIELVDRIQQSYWRSSEVDWAALRPVILAPMEIPLDIDPVPLRVKALVERLPGNSHTHLRPTPGADAVAPLATANKPLCQTIRPGIARLVLPATPLSPDLRQEDYVAAAHDCLLGEPRGTRWIVDLRGHGGGNSDTTIAALAPLLPAGKLLTWIDGRGEQKPVVLTSRGVETGGELPPAPRFDPASFPQVLGARSDAPVVVWLGKRCASACEAAAVALDSRAGVRTVGEPTAGLATANALIKVSAEWDLALTVARMRDARGVAIEDRVQPRLPLSTTAVEDIAALFEPQ